MYHHQANLLVFVALNQMSSLKALDERIAIYNNETPLNILLVKWSQLKLNLEIAVVKSNVLNFGVLPICLGLLVSCNSWWWVFCHKLFARQASLLANDTNSNAMRVTKLFASYLFRWAIVSTFSINVQFFIIIFFWSQYLHLLALTNTEPDLYRLEYNF